MAFTAQDVKKLREMTNVGMMDCKKALQATDATSRRLLTGSVKRAWPRLPRRLTALPPKALPMPPTWTAWAS